MGLNEKQEFIKLNYKFIYPENYHKEYFLSNDGTHLFICDFYLGKLY